MTSRRYDVPSGRVGRKFVGTLGADLKGVWDRMLNLERFIVFQTMILQRSRHVTVSQSIRQRIEKRLDPWAEGNHRMLVEETLWTYVEYLTIAQREDMAEHRSQTYYILVLCGKLRKAVRWITERETDRVLQPGDRCTKTGDRVMKVLRAKNPEARTSTAEILDSYPNRPPELTPVEITNEMVTAVIGQLSGGAGPGGTDSVLLQHWLLWFGAVSGKL